MKTFNAHPRLPRRTQSAPPLPATYSFNRDTHHEEEEEREELEYCYRHPCERSERQPDNAKNINSLKAVEPCSIHTNLTLCNNKPKLSVESTIQQPLQQNQQQEEEENYEHIVNNTSVRSMPQNSETLLKFNTRADTSIYNTCVSRNTNQQVMPKETNEWEQKSHFYVTDKQCCNTRNTMNDKFIPYNNIEDDRRFLFERRAVKHTRKPFEINNNGNICSVQTKNEISEQKVSNNMHNSLSLTNEQCLQAAERNAKNRQRRELFAEYTFTDKSKGAVCRTNKEKQSLNSNNNKGTTKDVNLQKVNSNCTNKVQDSSMHYTEIVNHHKIDYSMFNDYDDNKKNDSSKELKRERKENLSKTYSNRHDDVNEYEETQSAGDLNNVNNLCNTCDTNTVKLFDNFKLDTSSEHICEREERKDNENVPVKSFVSVDNRVCSSLAKEFIIQCRHSLNRVSSLMSLLHRTFTPPRPLSKQLEPLLRNDAESNHNSNTHQLNSNSSNLLHSHGVKCREGSISNTHSFTTPLLDKEKNEITKQHLSACLPVISNNKKESSFSVTQAITDTENENSEHELEQTYSTQKRKSQLGDQVHNVTPLPDKSYLPENRMKVLREIAHHVQQSPHTLDRTCAHKWRTSCTSTANEFRVSQHEHDSEMYCKANKSCCCEPTLHSVNGIVRFLSPTRRSLFGTEIDKQLYPTFASYDIDKLTMCDYTSVATCNVSTNEASVLLQFNNNNNN